MTVIFSAELHNFGFDEYLVSIIQLSNFSIIFLTLENINTNFNRSS